MNTTGLYLHIPFCKSKCRYCDFCSFPHPKDETVNRYVDALVAEIEEGRLRLTNHYGTPPTIDTVYFGGGTPTLLPLPLWNKIMEAIHTRFLLSHDAEITAECNPATADIEYLRSLRTLGINRLSIGAQSMNDGELRQLGRLHKSEDVVRAVSEARTAGFDNLSVDVMFGIPDQTLNTLRQTLEALTALSPKHISVYGLQIEEGTYFGRHASELALPDEDTEGAMYADTLDFLSRKGLPQYEISNFACPGFESRHNFKYWRRHDYLGLGLAAHSCLGDLRFSNTESMEDYLSARKEADVQHISAHDVLCEKIMLGLRLAEGLDLSALARDYGDAVYDYRKAFSPFIARNLMQEADGRLFFTREGMYVSNAILADVLDFDE